MIEQRAREILREHFRYPEFRNGQLEIIESIAEKNDTLVVMPTGGGKSLCYQIPAMLHEHTALVISPLIALMKDQVDSLSRARIKSAFINSSLQYHEQQQRLTNARFGAYKLLYIAPERLESKQFLEQLQTIPLSFIAVDEAHCISEWGHDFRPAYVSIPKLFEYIPRIPVIALTATATGEVQQDIVRCLDMKAPRKFIRGFDRPNLSYITEECNKKAERATDIIKETKEGSSIIYCGSRKRVEETANSLMRYGIQCEAYHAGMNEQQRSYIQERFISGEVKALAATSAFGMGVDKSDVRNVFHFDLTQTLEAYYQEAGRAGRDGQPSKCIMLYQFSDRKLQEFFISSTYPDKSTLQTLYNFIYDTLQAGVGVKPQQPLYLDETAIGSRINLSAIAVASALNVFERNGILRRGSTQGLAQLHIIAERPRLIEYFNNTTPERKVVLETLLRSVGSNAFEQPIHVDIQSMLRKHDIPHEQFTVAMRAFEYARLLRYEPASAAGGLSILLERVPISRLPVDYDALNERRQRATKKLDVVQRYAETHECKRNYILNYFQEDDITTSCGRCSSCTGKTQPKKVKHTEQDAFIQRAIVETVAECNGRFGRTTIAHILTGSNNSKLHLFNLKRCKNFGVLNSYKRNDVIQYIDMAISERLLQLSSDLNPVVQLTKLAERKYSSLPAPLQISIPKVSGAKVSATVQRLTRLRNDIASRYNMPVSTIATDDQLMEMAVQNPTTKNAFGKIKGIGDMFISRWAKEFLYVLRDETAMDDKHEEETQLPATVMTTLEYVRNGNSIEKIAEMRSLSTGTIAQHIQQALEKGSSVPRQHLISQNLYDVVRPIILRKPYVLLKDLRVEIGAEYDYALLRVVTAFVRRDIAIQDER